MQNETIQSLQRANRSLVNENLALLNELHNGYGALGIKLDRYISDLNAAVARLTVVEQAVLDIAAKQPRIEREVTRFERLNNANEWVKS